jgi:diguanylate cyclase (GGDEF)-like protein
MLDFSTLLTVTLFLSAVGGLLLLFAWLQNRSVAALGLWGLAYLMNTVALALLSARGNIPNFWSIDIAQTVWLGAHGLMWTAARNFEGRHTPLALTFAGAALWIAACQFEFFYSSLAARIVLSTSVIGTYLLLCAIELWRAQDRELVSRWPAIILLLIHATMFLGRIPLVNVLPYPGGALPPSPHWLPLGLFEVMFHTFCMSVLLVAMAKERAELRQRQNSLIDPLTGVANRRAFFDRAEATLRLARAEGRVATLLLFDLDRFKEINDTFGHQVGDNVLSRFCEVAKSVLRPRDLFGRFGGEEFACLLEDTSLADALRIAERVRGQFARMPLEIGGDRTVVTVSVGVAVSNEIDRSLTQLFAAADRALYRAKAKGRDRVEADRAPRLVVGASSPAIG